MSGEMLQLFHAFPFGKHVNQPIGSNDLGEQTGGNVFEGVSSCISYDRPGRCSVNIACSVGMPSAISDSLEKVRTTVFTNGTEAGHEIVPFRPHHNVYQLNGLEVYQWVQTVDFSLIQSSVLTCEFTFIGTTLELTIDRAMRLLAKLEPKERA